MSEQARFAAPGAACARPGPKRPPIAATAAISVADYTLALTMRIASLASRPLPEPSGTAVAIGLPGILETNERLYPAARALIAAGWDVRFVDELSQMRGPIPLLARKLERYIERNDLRNVTLFAHSKGGLVGREAMRGHFAGRIRGMVSLGTPYSGSPLAIIPPRFAGYDDLRTDNPSLHARFFDPKVNPKITSIQAKWDQNVPNGSWLPGARVVTARVYGHNALVAYPAALRVLTREMERFRP